MIQCYEITSTTDESALVTYDQTSVVEHQAPPPSSIEPTDVVPHLQSQLNLSLRHFLRRLLNFVKYLLPSFTINTLLYILFERFLDENHLEFRLDDKFKNYY